MEVLTRQHGGLDGSTGVATMELRGAIVINDGDHNGRGWLGEVARVWWAGE